MAYLRLVLAVCLVPALALALPLKDGGDVGDPSFRGHQRTSSLHSPSPRRLARGLGSTLAFQHVGLARAGLGFGTRAVLQQAKCDPKVRVAGSARWGFRMCEKGGGGKNDDDKDKTGIDRLFDPIVRRYAKLGEEEQKVLAAVYQSTYFMLCLYIGVVMVRAYRAWVYSSPPGGF